jgi:hypothetical protein
VEYSISDDRLIQALDLLRAVLASKLKNQAALADTFTSSSVKSI